MPSPKHDRYQDYVIRDGRLVGEFDEMYRDHADPWEQRDRAARDLDKAVGLFLLEKYGHTRALEYGCGLGQYTEMLRRRLGQAAGVDVSPTAIAAARARYPDASFFAGDLLDPAPLSSFEPDVLVLSEITWYVLDKLAAFKRLIAERPGCGFFHTLQIYPPGVQQYGREFFVDLDGIVRYWSDAIEIVEWGTLMQSGEEGGRTFFYGRVRERPR